MRPESEAELADLVREARGPLVLRGGGTRAYGRPVAGEVLSLAGLAGITLYEPAALTMVARAGTPLAEVEAVLADQGQRLAFEPLDLRGLLGTAGESTIGGVFATNASGPRRVQAGAARDHLLGVRFVDGRGNAIKNGGRVMKNVTGYDLVKLMAGAHGTLGVLSEVSFKVLPVPQTEATLVLESATPVAAMAEALGSPFEVSGAASTGGTVWLRLEGFAASVAYRVEQLRLRLRRFGAAQVEADAGASAALWRGIRDVAVFQGQAGDVWRLSVRPSDAPDLVARAGGEALLDWGGGLVWLRVEDGTDLRARLGGFAGHATLIRASTATRARITPFAPEAPAVAALTHPLRAGFDPRGILNPGLMT